MEMECHLLVAKYKLEQMAVQVKIFLKIIPPSVEQCQTLINFSNNLVGVLEELVQNVMLSP